MFYHAPTKLKNSIAYCVKFVFVVKRGQCCSLIFFASLYSAVKFIMLSKLDCCTMAVVLAFYRDQIMRWLCFSVIGQVAESNFQDGFTARGANACVSIIDSSKTGVNIDCKLFYASQQKKGFL